MADREKTALHGQWDQTQARSVAIIIIATAMMRTAVQACDRVLRQFVAHSSPFGGGVARLYSPTGKEPRNRRSA
jgi:hypothetical protein